MSVSGPPKAYDLVLVLYSIHPSQVSIPPRPLSIERAMTLSQAIPLHHPP